MGNKFEHRVVTDRHAKKLRPKNCDAFPLQRPRGSAQAATLQLAIIRPKSFLFSAQLEPPRGRGPQVLSHIENNLACQVSIFRLQRARKRA
jgi:hypothetical protein